MFAPASLERDQASTGCSWNSSNAESGKIAGLAKLGERFFLLLVGDVEAAAFVGEIQIVNTENAHAEAYLRADGIKRWVKGLFRNAEIRETHRNNAAGAPDEKTERRHHGHDFQRPLLRKGEIV